MTKTRSPTAHGEKYPLVAVSLLVAAPSATSDKAVYVNNREYPRQIGQVFLQGDFLLHCHHRIGRGIRGGVVWGYT
jgi:hypothetical protein